VASNKEIIEDLEARKQHFWNAIAVYTKQRDAHGVMDMAVEVQAVQYAINSLKELLDDSK
jgi:hypothetical protein